MEIVMIFRLQYWYLHYRATSQLTGSSEQQR
jgi:hypothetical protein